MLKPSVEGARRGSIAAALVAAFALLASSATAAAATPFAGDELLQTNTSRPRLVLSSLFTRAEFRARVTNASSQTVRGPIRVAVDVNRQVVNADGVTETGLPFVTLCADSSCELAPGATSAPVTIRYRAPNLLLVILGLVDRFAAEAEAQYVPFSMQLLHNADVDGVGPLANVRNFSGLLDALRSLAPDKTLYVSSGDNWIPGPTYASSADALLAPLLGIPGRGRGDVALFNAMGVQASAVGNHELDEGVEVFSSIIGPEVVDSDLWAGAEFPYLSSNIDFAGTAADFLVAPDGEPAAPSSIARSATVVVAGQTIGLVGAASPTFPQITNTDDAVVTPPLTADGTVDVEGLAAEIQAAVDALTAQGIDKVVLLAHMQRLDIERGLAELLSDVDVIVGGGSNTILADETDVLRASDVAGGTYPELYTSISGDPVALVNTDGDYTYLGRLVAAFDLSGRILVDELDPVTNGAYATDDDSLTAVFGAVPAANASVAELADTLGAVLAASEGNTFGFTDVFIDGRRATVRTQESNAGNLTADANLFVAQQADPSVVLSLKNGGGIRDDIGEIVFPPGSSNPEDVVFTPPAAIPGIKPAGGISQVDIANTLRFNNQLTLLTLTAEQLAAIFEHGVGFDGVGTVQSGRFPQIGGARFAFDPAAPAGSRVRSLDIVAEDGTVLDTVVEDGVVVSTASYRIVTLNFLAGGGDGYPFPDLADPAVNAVNLADVPDRLPAGVADFAAPGTEQDALAEFLAARFATPETAFAAPEVPRAEDLRIVFLAP